MPRARFPVVLFDMDGTLVDEKSAWEWVHDHFGVDNSDNVEAYLNGFLDDEAFMASDIALWTEASGGPVHIREVCEILAEAPLMRGANDLLDALNEQGVRTAIVSGGIDLLARRVADELGIELVLANGLATDEEGFLTGEGVCRVWLEDKATPSRWALEKLGCAPGQGVGVGNSRYDVGMFEIAGHGVAFAPLDDHVRRGADVVVESHDMTDLVPVLLEGVP